MRITTFSNNRIFGQGRAAQTKNSSNSANVAADMAQTLRDNAQSDLQSAAEKQAAVSRQDRVELAVKSTVQKPVNYAKEIYQALAGVDNKQELEAQMEAQAAKAMQEALRREAENAKDQAEAAKQAMDYMLKMMEIARRISTGGQVPGADEQKLMEYSQVLYIMAKTLAMQAKEHEKYDSLFEDEEQNAAGGSGDVNIEGTSEINVETASCNGGGSGSSGAVLAGD